MSRWRARRIKDAVMGAAALLATALTLFPILDILYVVVRHSLPALRPSLFTQVTSGTGGGLANAIVGTLLIVGVTALFAVPIGVLGGLYIGEFDRGPLADAIRFAADVLAGVPSIVMGYFGYVAMVLSFGWGFSALAAGVTLAILTVPYVIRSTESAVERVSQDLRQASLALGASRAFTVWRVVLRSARPGILTGILLALSISLGETAPLIYTAGWSNYMPTLRLTHAPVAYLTYVVWNFINEPFASANALAYAAAFILVFLILIINVAVRTLLRRQAPGG